MELAPCRHRKNKNERFCCPFPGCRRSFIDLWRLKVHYRADPDVRGSGRERGHGKELPACPKCKKRLERGRHHVNCAAGKAAPSQANRRMQRACRERSERMRSQLESMEDANETTVSRDMSFSCAAQPGLYEEPALCTPASLTPVENFQLTEPVFQNLHRVEGFETQMEPLTAFPLQNGSCFSPNEVPDVNITAGYAVFLRSDMNSRPSVYFVPGETVEVSVKETPFLHLNDPKG